MNRLVLITFASFLLFGCSDDGDTPTDAAGELGLDAGMDAVGEAAVDGSTDGSTTPTVKTCNNPAMTAPTEGTCSVTKGTGKGLLLRGELLLPGQVLINGHLLIDGQGKIACVDCDCSADSLYKDATVVECAKGVISPGLINSHDHLAWAQSAPKTNTTRYDHRHEWRKGLNGKAKISAPMGKSSAVWWGELRNIMGGATSIIGSSNKDMLLRNLDKDNEGLGIKTATYSTFPLGDSSGKMLKNVCTYPKLPSLTTVKAATAWIPHVAEGVNDEARNEFLCMNGGQTGGVDVTLANVAFIHSVGLTATDALDMAKDGTSVIWSPRTNISLYGFTANVVMFDRMGITVALGTDWAPSGSINMLRELACAAYLNDSHYGGHFKDHELWEMATINGARVAAADKVIGKLAKGYFADVTIFDGTKNSAHAAVLKAGVADVALVLRGGVALYGDDAVVAAVAPSAGTGCEALTVCTTKKRICVERETKLTLAALKTAVGTPYDLFFCGTPTGEPTCVPSRPSEYTGKVTATDSDGDGIDDTKDNCPKVFNPVRPMDNKVQSDTDSDKVGDACDVCPLDANTTKCTSSPDPNDKDGDGIVNAKDNCPNVVNKDQKDTDKDGIGDACDSCPKPNPAGSACPATIKELRDTSLGKRPSDGSTVALTGVTVVGIRTAKTNNYGFYIREGKGKWEAIFVYNKNDIPKDTTGTALKEGDVISLEGTITLWNKIDQIENAAKVTVTGSGLADPVDVTTDKLQQGSTSAEELESQLVRVKSVTVKAKVSATDSFWVTDSSTATCTGTSPACTQVGDFFYDGSTVDGKPASTVGGTFSSIVGVINGYKDLHTLDPRTSSDLVSP